MSERINGLDMDLRRLGVTRRVHPRVRVAAVRRAHLRYWLIYTCGLGALTIVAAVVFRYHSHPKYSFGPFGVVPPAVRPIYHWAGSVISAAVITPLACLLGEIAGALVNRRSVWSVIHDLPWGRTVGLEWMLAARRYALVMEIVDAIAACSRAYAAGGERQATALRHVSKKLGAVTRGLRTGYRLRSSVPRFSHRRKALDKHARQVVAALRSKEARLDVDPRAALPQLADMLLTIAERYCQARVGALLDETDLEGVPPGPDREWLRIAVAAVLCAGAVVGIAELGLADGAEPIVMLCACLVIISVVWNRRVRRAFDLLGIVLGS
ncbi:hypothetical protein [Streptomyces rhizosphaericus]|uniref:Uncharacterized protein n=1 Tax=Streptomyces rhizosphaericus TaxID=114699 RepID=A0A6G4AVR5_9ACTN|nr:hypothetical protein [Streptomyces rhizosphaericus]NEW77340.1 hypothetical protein [Streptomyces rhizosphaericus]